MAEFLVVLLAIAIGVIVLQHLRRPKLKLSGMEKLIGDGEADGRDVAEAAYWTNKAVSQVGVPNSVQKELDTQILNKNKEAEGAREKAREITTKAKENADELRRRAKEVELEGETNAEKLNGVGRAAQDRLKRLEHINSILNPQSK